jgi:hypothetical protein
MEAVWALTALPADTDFSKPGRIRVKPIASMTYSVLGIRDILVRILDPYL